MRRSPEERRRDTVEACHALIVGRPYEPGSRDCLKLARHAMHGMGHRLKEMLRGVRYRTEAGALRAMKARGYADLTSAVDATGRPRIAPASALPADLLLVKTEADGAFGGALAVYVGNGKVITFVDGVGAIGALKEPPLAAWRL